MGGLISIQQPTFNINVIGRKFIVLKDDPENGLMKGDIISPISYRVIHGISSLMAHDLYLETISGHKLLVKIFNSQKDGNYYFHVSGRYPEHDSTKYKGCYDVDLHVTDRLKPIS